LNTSAAITALRGLDSCITFSAATCGIAAANTLRKRLAGVTLRVAPVPAQPGASPLSKRVTLVKAKRRRRS